MRRTNGIILICVETTKEAKTDSIYIDKTLKYVYNVDNETKIEYEYLTSKTKYNDRGVKRRIERMLPKRRQATLLVFLTSFLLRNNQNKPVNNISAIRKNSSPKRSVKGGSAAPSRTELNREIEVCHSVFFCFDSMSDLELLTEDSPLM